MADGTLARLFALAAEPHDDDIHLVGVRGRGGSVQYERAALACLLRIEQHIKAALPLPEVAPAPAPPKPEAKPKAKAKTTRTRKPQKG